MRPKVAIALGDPRGIGPEVAIGAGSEPGVRADMSLTWIGPDEVLGGAPAADPHVSIGSWDGTSDGAGRVAAVAIERAAKGALRGDFHAVVTAPLHKPSLRSAGWDVPGQTELLQNLAAAPSVGMLMAAETTLAGGALRVLLATTHHALRQVPDLITIELLLAQIRLLDESLKEDWGLPAPRLALCALNPHASDDGLFGSEEASIFTPAVDCARAGGVQIDGPLPADTVFRRALMGDFDAVVAPYHDVGMAAFKTVSFGQGVNVTLGLPFIRTSPDHGTAFDIAGSGTADPSSMAAALLMAARLARNRFDTDSASV